MAGVTKFSENSEKEMRAMRQGQFERRESLVLAPDFSGHVNRSFAKQWKRYRKEVKQCQKKFSKGAVHDSRVAARRLLATIELLEGFLRPEMVKQAHRLIKKHLDIFDDLRDAHVQLVAIRKLEATFPAAREFCQWLRKREARYRKDACMGVRRSKSKPLAKLIAACEDKLQDELKKQSSTDAANVLLRTVAKAFQQALQSRERIHSARPKTIHRTRIAFKRFRYMLELLADDLGVDDQMLSEMQHYQTMMGDIQDAEVLLQSFDKFARKKNIRSKPATELRDELARRREWLIRVYMDAAAQLKDFWPVPKPRL